MSLELLNKFEMSVVDVFFFVFFFVSNMFYGSVKEKDCRIRTTFAERCNTQRFFGINIGPIHVFGISTHFVSSENALKVQKPIFQNEQNCE